MLGDSGRVRPLRGKSGRERATDARPPSSYCSEKCPDGSVKYVMKELLTFQEYLEAIGLNDKIVERMVTQMGELAEEEPRLLPQLMLPVDESEEEEEEPEAELPPAPAAAAVPAPAPVPVPAEDPFGLAALQQSMQGGQA